jgi:hypothetical protein
MYFSLRARTVGFKESPFPDKKKERKKPTLFHNPRREGDQNKHVGTVPLRNNFLVITTNSRIR